MSTPSATSDPAPGEAGLDPLEICTLSTDSLAERLAWLRSEVLAHAVTSERNANGIAWELDDVPGLATTLDRLIALERECCSGIAFEHRTSRTPGRRRLELRGIDPHAAVFATLAADAGAPRRLGGRLAKASGRLAKAIGRLAKAIGAGTLLSLLVCCALPIAAAALLGASAAAPLASLDHPWTIAGMALLFGALAYAWQHMRPAQTRESGGTTCGPDC